MKARIKGGEVRTLQERRKVRSTKNLNPIPNYSIPMLPLYAPATLSTSDATGASSTIAVAVVRTRKMALTKMKTETETVTVMLIERKKGETARKEIRKGTERVEGAATRMRMGRGKARYDDGHGDRKLSGGLDLDHRDGGRSGIAI